MHKKICKLIAFLLIIISVSCVKEQLYEKQEDFSVITPPIVDTTVVTPPVDTFPDEILSNIQIILNESPVDEAFWIIAGENKILLSSAIQSKTLVVDPGRYDVYAYNESYGTIINNEVASMHINEEGMIIPHTSYALFSSAFQEVTVYKNKTTIVNIKPEQNTGQLTLKLDTIPFLYLFENISIDSNSRLVGISGKLTNVARSFNVKTQKEEYPDTLMFDFWNEDPLHLFGFMPGEHVLILEFHYENGNSKEAEIDLSLFLNDFNLNKKQPKSIIIPFIDLILKSL